jgi:hypothetical protein
MLQINDPALVGVNPHNPNLSQEMMTRIILESKNNLWYFLREVVRIPTQEGIKSLCLHRGSSAQIWLTLQHISNCLVVPRRNYKTTNIAAVLVWAECIALHHGNIALFANKFNKNKENLDIIKGIIKELPEYMRHDLGPIKKDTKKDRTNKFKAAKAKSTTEEYIDPTTQTRMMVFPEAVRESAANQFGRGSAHNIQYYDEAEFIPYLKVILAASGPTYREALNASIRSGSPACRIYTSTPGYTNNPVDRQNYEEIISTFTKWEEFIYDMTTEQIKAYAEEHTTSETGMVTYYIEYDYIQCRRDEEWLLGMLKDSPERNRFRREVLLERVSGNETSPFGQNEIEYINSHKIAPKTTINIYKDYELSVYDHLDYPYMGLFDPSAVYFIGVDPAFGVGGDSTAISIGNPNNMKTAAEFRSEFVGKNDVVAIILKIFDMIPKAVLFCEARASGIPIMEDLAATHIGSRIYTTTIKDPYKAITEQGLSEEKMLIKVKQAKEAAARKSMGIPTSFKTRRMMIDLLISHMHEYKGTIRTPNLIEDINGLIYIQNSKENSSMPKIAAGPGCHDDTLMAWLMWLYGWYYGENLNRFGFAKGAHPISDFNVSAIEEQKMKQQPRPSAEDREYDRAYAAMAREIKASMRLGVTPMQSVRISNIQYEEDFTEYLDIDRSQVAADSSVYSKYSVGGFW